MANYNLYKTKKTFLTTKSPDNQKLLNELKEEILKEVPDADESIFGTDASPKTPTNEEKEKYYKALPEYNNKLAEGCERLAKTFKWNLNERFPILSDRQDAKLTKLEVGYCSGSIYPNDNPKKPIRLGMYRGLLEGELDLSEYTNLTEIYIQGGDITDFKLGALPNLTTLIFGDGFRKVDDLENRNQDSIDLADIGSYNNLRVLRLGRGNNFKGGLGDLKNCVNLEWLDISNNPLIAIDGLEDLPHENLKHFACENTQLMYVTEKREATLQDAKKYWWYDDGTGKKKYELSEMKPWQKGRIDYEYKTTTEKWGLSQREVEIRMPVEVGVEKDFQIIPHPFTNSKTTTASGTTYGDREHNLAYWRTLSGYINPYYPRGREALKVEWKDSSTLKWAKKTITLTDGSTYEYYELEEPATWRTETSGDVSSGEKADQRKVIIPEVRSYNVKAWKLVNDPNSVIATKDNKDEAVEAYTEEIDRERQIRKFLFVKDPIAGNGEPLMTTLELLEKAFAWRNKQGNFFDKITETTPNPKAGEI